eukprot:gnl/TRDRNA2_/TRDRNA2_161095_c0_seq2.p1 gnl/TRDRNA2_/TRDRNA2_161095_c0~~gnl/TRDRNA2_/TRDRNA2_161095_c0_seq2.p1  ORF type:complete len:174 (+),score=36.82 gnl/TRDRNA2_/TRDRNA2_161095_c0_seq2:503-1024(+)
MFNRQQKAPKAIERVDLEQMRVAASCLVGTYNFSAFQSKGGERSSTTRTLYRCDVKPLYKGRAAAGGTAPAEERGEGRRQPPAEAAGAGELVGVQVIVEADGFLYNMMRILAGTLLEVGCGVRTVEDTAALLQPDSTGSVPAREESGPRLPAAGLCLEHVEYKLPAEVKARPS